MDLLATRTRVLPFLKDMPLPKTPEEIQAMLGAVAVYTATRDELFNVWRDIAQQQPPEKRDCLYI